MAHTIGVIGPPEDQEVKVLAERLAHRGAQPWVVDLGSFPRKLAISLSADDVLVEGRSLREMDVAYLRRIPAALPEHARGYESVIIDEPVRWRQLYEPTVRVFEQERANQAMRTTVVQWLSQQRPVINPPRQQNLHRLKTWYVWLMRNRGIPVPETAVGSDRDALRRFAEQGTEQWGGVVDKPPAGIYKTHLYDAQRFSAHRWGQRPALYQRYVKGQTVRCYVLAGKLLSAAGIVHGGTVDSSLSQTGIEVLELAPTEREMVEATATRLGLAFCGMDWQRDEKTGKGFVIDCNLSPLFVNYGKLSRCDIAGHIAEHLISLATGDADRQRPAVLDVVDEAKELLARDPEIAELLRDVKIPKRG